MKKFSIAIVGYGSQAKAWAQNLRDSEQNVSIYLREESPSFPVAQADGFSAFPIHEIKEHEYDYLLLLTPDDTHLSFLEKFSPHLKTETKIIYAHGFSVSKENLREKFNSFQHILLAPKAIALEVREKYQYGEAINALYDCSEKQLDSLKVLAYHLGFFSLYPSTFEEETIADLFSEQSLLCSLIPYGALDSYNKLREKGISKEAAYLECWTEMKLIVDTLMKLGPEKFFEMISPNALLGAKKAREIIMGDNFQKSLSTLFEEIENKKFYRETESDIKPVRDEVLNFWKQQELTQTIKELERRNEKA